VIGIYTFLKYLEGKIAEHSLHKFVQRYCFMMYLFQVKGKKHQGNHN